MRNELNVCLLCVAMACSVAFIAGCAKDDPNSKNNDPDLVTVPVKDIDGNSYDTVHVEGQVWLKQNLATTHLNDGTPLGTHTNGSAWGTMNAPGYCWYNNDFDAYGKVYGALYNMYAVNTGKLCPKGWHVPSAEEVQSMATALGGIPQAGGAMKSTDLWKHPNYGATNSSGFTGLPGGYRFCQEGEFLVITEYGLWWTSSIASEDSLSKFGKVFSLMYDLQGLHIGPGAYHYGNSVRCILD
jgi:uncharacterized protein (TIGR02145 family)